MGLETFLAAAKKFFREDTAEVVGAYFDGMKLFVARLTEKFETVELDAEYAELEQIAEKISLTCKQRGWRTSSVGFCLQDGDAVIYQMTVDNLPAKAIPASVKAWAVAQAGKDAVFAFTNVGDEIWMETLPRTRFDEICAAFKKFGLNLRGLSVMPSDSPAEVTPFDRTKFIAKVVRNNAAPNILAARSVWRWQRISAAAAVIFLIALMLATAKVFWDGNATSNALDAAKLAVNEIGADVALKKSLDADIAELHRLNALAAAQVDTPKNFNLLINLGKIADKTVRLTKIRADENSLTLEGIADTPEAVKAYLVRVKGSVAQGARLENSAARDDGDIAFTIRAALKQN